MRSSISLVPVRVRRLFVLFVGIFLATAGTVFATTAAAAPTGAAAVTELQPASVHQNRTISIVGSGFTPNGKVTWKLLDPNSDVVSSDTGSTDDDGTAYRQVTPTTTTPPGAYTLTITDGTTDSVASTTLQVLPAANAPPLSVTLKTEPGSDGTTVSPPPSGPYIHFRNGVASIHQERITGISAHNLPEHSAITWKVLGPDGTDVGTWEGTASDGSNSQWLAAPSGMEPGMYTVEVLAASDSATDAVAWAAFEVLPAADAPPHRYDVEVSSADVERGDVVTATVTGGGIHAGLIPVNAITDRSVSENLSQPDEIGRRAADFDTSGLPPEYDVFYVAVHDGRTWHLTGTEISVGEPANPSPRTR